MKSSLGILLSLLSLIIMVLGCNNDIKQETTAKMSDSELEAIIIQQVDSLYKVYQKIDYDWIEFFEDGYTAIYPDSPVQIITKDSLRAQWKRIYNKYDVKLLDRGRPSVILTEDMAISHNSFNEIFINKTSLDTIKNVGTYIISWRKQPDDTWKIAFETLQNN